MKNNIAIVCLDRSMARATAQLLAEQLDMRMMDMRDLFNFDHKPNTFKQMITTYGSTYYRQKECSIIKYASDFNNIVLIIDSDAFFKKGTLAPIQDNYLTIYMQLPVSKLKSIVEKEEYSCYKEKAMYNLTKKQLETRDQTIRSQSDIIVDVQASSYFKASADIIRAIHKYYKV